jgi:pimeloyl-ACP methyl ester carboxylesterase
LSGQERARYRVPVFSTRRHSPAPHHRLERANLLFIHGLPDFWNGWRYQIAHFKTPFRVAAVDLRGVNLSDKPAGLSAFRMIEFARDTVGLSGAGHFLHQDRADRVNLELHRWLDSTGGACGP